MKKLIIAAALLALSAGAAEAQTKPIRADGGMQSAQQSAWTGATGVPGLYYQTSVGWRARKPDNSEITLGAGGGGSTLALTYAAGASQTDTTVTYDATRGFFKLLDASSTLGTLFQLRNNADSLTYVSFTSNSQHFFRSGAVDGSSAVGTAVDTNTGWVNATSKPFRVLTGGAERFSVTGPGNLNLVANASIVAAAASTNTVGLSHVANVATGASSIAHALNNTTDLTSGTLLSIQSAGTQRFGFQWDGTVAFLTGGSAITSFLANDGTGFQGNSGVAYVRNAGVATYQFTSTDLTPMGAQKLGTSATPWPATFSKHYAGGGTAPTKAAGTCIGGTQTVSLDANATDTTGTLTFTGTGTGTAAGICATVTFNGTWPTAPHCYVTPANAASNALSGNSAMFVDAASTTTGVFVVKVGSTALLAGTYLLNYVCIQ